ncbi:MAG TPA: hydrogen gas-evolving membrane-bound hydrogenase subunit E [Pseudonocardiaceae bacterium]|nr:hydrogen gas-evolving membrane-bound hydrogenase subunit E [Pseudonocardiaceae bacterium]
MGADRAARVGHYPGPYGDIINAIAVPQTHTTGVVSTVNFEYRAFDTLGEEFILFIAATGVATVLRHLRQERDTYAVDDVFKRLSPVALIDAIEAIGAGSFAAVGIAALASGAAYLTNILPLGSTPGAVTLY